MKLVGRGGHLLQIPHGSTKGGRGCVDLSSRLKTSLKEDLPQRRLSLHSKRSAIALSSRLLAPRGTCGFACPAHSITNALEGTLAMNSSLAHEERIPLLHGVKSKNRCPSINVFFTDHVIYLTATTSAHERGVCSVYDKERRNGASTGGTRDAGSGLI